MWIATNSHTGILSCHRASPPGGQTIGRAAERVIERVRAGEVVDVSVGLWGQIKPEAGIYDGQKYQGRWTGIMPDHLAMLPEGTPGACSIDMGCGAPR